LAAHVRGLRDRVGGGEGAGVGQEAGVAGEDAGVVGPGDGPVVNVPGA